MQLLMPLFPSLFESNLRTGTYDSKFSQCYAMLCYICLCIMLCYVCLVLGLITEQNHNVGK